MKNKDWENIRVLLEWEKIHTNQISGDHHTKQDGSKEDLIVLQDNLDDQVHKQYQDICQLGDNTLCWHFHLEYIDDLDPPDAGVGNQIIFWFEFYPDE